MRYPGLLLNIDRERASQVGLTTKGVVDNVITALTSDGMIAPSYWIDPKTGNNYMVTVQYSTHQIDNMTMEDFRNIPLRGDGVTGYTPLQSVAHIQRINTPTEVDHYRCGRRSTSTSPRKPRPWEWLGNESQRCWPIRQPATTCA